MSEEREATASGKSKRPRVALACQRCKSRKQKCNGVRPTCGNCASFDASCVYLQRKHHSCSHDGSPTAAELRVIELEGLLLREGISMNELPAQQGRRDTHQGFTSDSSAHNDSRTSTKRPHDGSPAPTLEGEPEPIIQEDGPTKRAEFTSVLEVLRDLSIEASGGYIGASSSITMSRMVGSLVKSKERGSLSLRPEEHFSPKSLPDDGFEDTRLIDTASLPQDIADKLLKGYLKHISTRWPILHSAYIRSLHSRRSTLTDSYELCTLHLVYASGGRFLETTGETGAFFCDRHHAAAMNYLDEILQCHDVRMVQVLILLAIYSLRAPKGPGAWTYIGLAMRACIDLGMHRKSIAKGTSLLENEMRKRIFYTCYSLDRQVSIIIGRPFAISDRDIDAELPLDVDESVQDTATLEAVLANSKTLSPNQAPTVSTSLSCFIHICRLRRIESHIQQSIYRVDVDQQSGVANADVEAFIRQLEDWRESIPQDARRHNADKPSTRTDTLVIDGYGYYMVYYYKCLRFLFHPLLSAPDANINFIRKCAEACGGVCETYKKLHQNISVGFSLMALHSVFLAGLTLVYCTWIAPQELFSIATSNAMNACSIVLYVITERWPGAKKYRDMYESVKQSVLESIEESKYEPRRAIKRLNPGLYSTLDKNEEGRAEVNRMVSDMAGKPLPSDDGFHFASPSSYMQNFPGEVPLPFQSATLEFPQQMFFDPSLSSFQDFDFGSSFSDGEYQPEF